MRKTIILAALATAGALSLCACAKHDTTTENTTEATTITDDAADGNVSVVDNALDANGFDSETTPIENADDGTIDNDAGNGL